MERFWSKVHMVPCGGCWIWTGAPTKKGYGRFTLSDRLPSGRYPVARAHRLSYELEVGPIPDGLTLDHSCENKLCVNPAHLEPVPSGENSRRAKTGKVKSRCPRGHPYSGSNLIVRNDGRRECRECTQARDRARYYRKKEA